MPCQRCGSLMLEFGITLSGDALTQKRISAWHCRTCGRFEYGGLVDISPIPAVATPEATTTISDLRADV